MHFQTNDVHTFTGADILSMSGEAQIATTAARCMVMLSAANIKAREEAIGAGTIRILLKLAAYQEDGV